MAKEQREQRSLKQLREDREASIGRRKRRRLETIVFLALTLGNLILGPLLLPDPFLIIALPGTSFFFAIIVFQDYRRQNRKIEDIEEEIADRRRKQRRQEGRKGHAEG